MSNRTSQEADNSKYTRIRSLMHVIVGLLYIVLGIAVITFHAFGQFELQPGLAYGMGALLLVYGAFRIWRGYTGLRQR
jgi:uncharacterized membrane protein HdeD (DUF308 family)